MERSSSGYQDHYSLPLPPIENFAYNEQSGMIEQGQLLSPHHYNFDYARCQAYGYRNVNENYFQTQGQPYQEYVQQLEMGQHQVLCNPVYQQHHVWNSYDVNSMIPNIAEMGHVDLGGRARHKRSRMSLQKRLLVNARERERMRVLNKAFEALRDALPCYIADGHMAKITTLRLAINYIKALTEVLEEEKESDLEKQKGCEDMKVDSSRSERIALIKNEDIDESIELKTEVDGNEQLIKTERDDLDQNSCESMQNDKSLH